MQQMRRPLIQTHRGGDPGVMRLAVSSVGFFLYFPVTLCACLHHIHGQSPCIPCGRGIFTVLFVQLGCKEEELN